MSTIERGGVIGILSAADQVAATVQLAERQGQALNAIRELHRPWEFDGAVVNNYCRLCATPMPCPTVRAINEAGA